MTNLKPYRLMKFSTNLIVILLAVLLTTNACAYTYDQNAQPYLTKTFTVNGAAELLVVTSGGSIDVSSHAGDKIIVEMYVRKGNKSFGPEDSEIEDALDDYTIELNKNSNKVIASAKRESSSWFNSNNNISISFKVSVPERTSCKLNTSGGSIGLAGVKGKQEVKTSGGSLSLTNIDGNMEAYTSGGSIKIKDYAGILDANTSGGSISLERATGAMSLHTSGGNISLEDIRGSIVANTSGGNISASLNSLEKELKLSTSGGNIKTTLPSGLGLDLDLKGNRVHTQLSNFSGKAEKDRIVGTMNGGGIPVKLSTSGGNVSIEYR